MKPILLALGLVAAATSARAQWNSTYPWFLTIRNVWPSPQTTTVSPGDSVVVEASLHYEGATPVTGILRFEGPMHRPAAGLHTIVAYFEVGGNTIVRDTVHIHIQGAATGLTFMRAHRDSMIGGPCNLYVPWGPFNGAPAFDTGGITYTVQPDTMTSSGGWCYRNAILLQFVYRVADPAGVADAPTAQHPQPAVYPNPATTSFTVEATGVTQVALLDLAGRVVKAWTQQGTETVQRGELAAGLYLIRLKDSHGTSATRVALR